MADTPLTPIEVGLTAAIVAVEADDPLVLVAGDPKSDTRAGLPFGPFDPLAHRTFAIGLRSWVAAQTGLNVGYVEQLYTFGDRGRHARPGDAGPHVVSVGYLALTRIADNAAALRTTGAGFEPWYRFFPWEDWRAGRPEILQQAIIPLLEHWAKSAPDDPARPQGRRERLRLTFGIGSTPWDEEKVLDRYEMLYEAGLVEEARRDGRVAATARAKIPPLGEPMRFDQRRILATAIARLRAKLKYRPVVFELMPPEFTLTELQRMVEAISGRHLHKQNFRRLVENAELVEPTGETSTATGGRPAAQFRFRREVVQERPATGLRVGRRRDDHSPERLRAIAWRLIAGGCRGNRTAASVRRDVAHRPEADECSPRPIGKTRQDAVRDQRPVGRSGAAHRLVWGRRWTNAARCNARCRNRAGVAARREDIRHHPLDGCRNAPASAAANISSRSSAGARRIRSVARRTVSGSRAGVRACRIHHA